MKKNFPVTQNEIRLPKGEYIVSKTDLKGIITFVNDTFVEVSGFLREELIGKNHNVVRHPDMPPAAFADLWATMKEERPWRGLVKNRCKNGDYYWVEALVVPVRKDNQTIGYMSVRTEPGREQVREAEALYARLNQGAARLPAVSRWSKTPLEAKFIAFLGLVVVAQPLGALVHHFRPALVLAPEGIDTLLAGISIAAGLGLAVLHRQLFTSLKGITRRLDLIAQGDLTEDVPLHRHDERGRLNNAIVTMQTHLKTMVAEIAHSARIVADNTEQLSAAAGRTHRVSEEQSAAVSGIAAAMEEMASSVSGVAEGVERTAEAVTRSGRLLDDAATRMQASRNASRQVVDAVTQASQTMGELFKSTHAIGVVTHAIKDIADQTNLLALNAAIEAARAGETGRGFAVVADEVRKLAERVSGQTEEITRTVTKIQQVTQIAVSEMESAGAFVRDTDQAMADAEASLAEVSNHGAEVAGMANNILMSTHEQSSASNEIAHQTTGIMAGIDETAEATGNVRQQAEDMGKAAGHLEGLIRYFRFIRD